MLGSMLDASILWTTKIYPETSGAFLAKMNPAFKNMAQLGEI
jgi:hypothetical protein